MYLLTQLREHAFQSCSSNSTPSRRASLSRRTVGNVKPRVIRRCRSEVSIEQVRCYGQRVLGGGLVEPFVTRPDAVRASQPSTRRACWLECHAALSSGSG